MQERSDNRIETWSTCPCGYFSAGITIHYYPTACPPVCLSSYLPIQVSLCVSVCLCVCLSVLAIYLTIFLSISTFYLDIHLRDRLCTCICPSVYLSSHYLPAYLATVLIYLSISLSFYHPSIYPVSLSVFRSDIYNSMSLANFQQSRAAHLTSQCASQYGPVHCFNLPTSTSALGMLYFLHI